MNTWKLHVEGLGKIGKADVEVGPFTMFVGDNNSGKSYLMTLIWGIRTNRVSDIWTNETNEETLTKIRQMESYRESVDILELFVDDRYEKDSIHLTLEQMKHLMNLYNELLCLYKEKIGKLIFLDDKIKIKKVKVEIIDVAVLDFLKWKSRENFETYLRNTVWHGKQCKNEELFKVSTSLFLLNLICDVILGGKQVYNTNSINSYFPASRTGFVLTYKMLIDYVLRPSLREHRLNNMDLTLPCIDFIQCINWINKDYEMQEYTDIIEFMNNNVISGEVLLKNNIATEIVYTPGENKNIELPMKLCSGVVTEVALVIMFLKYLGLSSITIEEPEMCLHPKLQWQYARAFIKMYNSGLPICMATHSDIFMAQVNNMIKLNSHPDKDNLMKQYGYEKNDLISAKDVKVYEFHVKKDGYTDIIEIKADEDGFQIPSFQKALRELLNQSMDFEMEE